MEHSSAGVTLAPPPNTALSDAQARLWDLETHLGNAAVHVFALAYELDGPLNVPALEGALAHVAHLHEALRVRVITDGGKPGFVAVSPPSLERRQGTAIDALLREEAATPIDVGARAGWRAVLIERGIEQFTLLLQFHHVIADRASVGVFMSDLSVAYRALQAGEPLADAPRGRTAMSARPPVGADAAPLVDYWRSLFAALPAPLDIPGALPVDSFQNYEGARIEARLGAGVTAMLKQIADTDQMSLFTLLLTAFAATLHAQTGQRDIVLCTPMAGRHRAGTRRAIGYFNNIVPLRLDLSGDPTFRELAARVAVQFRGAFANQDLPFHEIAGLPELSGSRLTQCLFALQNIPGLRLEIPGIRSRYFDVANGTANFDVALFAEETEGDLLLLLDHKTGVVPPAGAEQLRERFFDVLRIVGATPTVRLSGLPRFAPDATEAVATAIPPAADPRIPSRYTRDTQLELRIVEIWRDVFRSADGADSQAIDAESHFFRMGGDSIRAARMFQRMEEEFGHKLPLATLLEAPTPRQIAERLANEDWVAPWVSVLPVKTSGSRAPIFGLQAGGGNVLPFGYISERLHPDQPMYCLQPYGLERGALSTVEEMAVHYLGAIRQLRPNGPYLLVGASLGGAVVYEMAQRLVAAGESVTFVGLIDYAGPRLQYSLRERISDHLMYMRTLPWPGRLDYLMRWVKHRLGVKDAKETESIAPTEQANSAFLESSLHALQSYVVRPYPGHVSLFRARQGSPSVLADPQGGWGGFTAGFEVFDVSGTHTTITHPPHVHDLGDALARALQNSDRRARDQASETSSKS